MYRRSLIFLYFALQYALPLWCTQFYNIYITTYSILLAVFKNIFFYFSFFFSIFPLYFMQIICPYIYLYIS